MKNAEENGRDQESQGKRHFTVMVIAKDPKYRRYVCDKCLWNIDVLATNVGEAKEAFDAHNCKDYRQRDSLT
jgi:hypothetical protein